MIISSTAQASWIINNNVMNNKTLLLIATIFSLMLSACSGTLSFTVHGKAGTQILSPAGEVLATLNSAGEARVKIPRKHKWYPYMLSYDPADNSVVPFGLDYTRSSKGLVPKSIFCYSPIAVLPTLGVSGYAMVDYSGNPDVYGQYSWNAHQYTNQEIPLTAVTFNKFVPEAAAPTQTHQASKPKDSRPPKDSASNQYFVHTVQKGETLAEIANTYDVRPRDIIRWNNLTGSPLRVGQKLKIRISE